MGDEGPEVGHRGPGMSEGRRVWATGIGRVQSGTWRGFRDLSLWVGKAEDGTAVTRWGAGCGGYAEDSMGRGAVGALYAGR